MAVNPNPSKLDATQIAQRVFDGDDDRLRVDAEVTANFAGAQEVVIDEADDSIAIYGNDGATNRAIKTDSNGNVSVVQVTDPWIGGGEYLDIAPTLTNEQYGTFQLTTTGRLKGDVTQSGSWDVNDINGTISLPTGAATEATLASINSNTIYVDTDDVTVVASALPTGASTEAKQDVGNASLVSIDAGIPAGLGQTTMSASMPVVVASDQSRIPVQSSPIEGLKTTYVSAVSGLVAASLATDIFTVTGSGTKTIKIIRINVSGTQNTSAARDFLLIKRSTANSGGTSTTPAVVPLDSTSAAGTAVVRAYTVNPTVGTTVGTIRAQRAALLATNVTNPNHLFTWTFGDRPGQALTLRGTSEVIAVNLNGVTSSNNSFSIDVEWTEE